MSVMVNGMNVPESCIGCPFQQWDGEDTICYFTWVSALNIGRQGACPINEGFNIGYWAGRRGYAEPKWIPVTERVPNGNGEYLVSGKDKVWVCEFMILGGVGGWCNSAMNPCVEYWMQLPEPPGKESE